MPARAPESWDSSSRKPKLSFTEKNARVCSSAQVIDVTLMVVVGMLACQDDEVDAAIATPQVLTCALRHGVGFDAPSDGSCE